MSLIYNMNILPEKSKISFYFDEIAIRAWLLRYTSLDTQALLYSTSVGNGFEEYFGVRFNGVVIEHLNQAICPDILQFL